MGQTALIYAIVGGLVAYAAFIALGSWVAEEKGRGATEGMVLAALFGPFGVLIGALLPDKRPGEKR